MPLVQNLFRSHIQYTSRCVYWQSKLNGSQWARYAHAQAVAPAVYVCITEPIKLSTFSLGRLPGMIVVEKYTIAGNWLAGIIINVNAIDINRHKSIECV